MVFGEYTKIKQEYPEFLETIRKTKEDAIAQCEEAWGLKFGGVAPGNKEFGETTIRPSFFGIGTTTARETWNRNFSTAGWQDMIDNETIEDVYICLLGWIFTSPTKTVSMIKVESGDRKLPVVNVEGEIDAFETPAIIYKMGEVIPEETSVKVRVYTSTAGHQVVKPLGFALAKPKIMIDESPNY